MSDRLNLPVILSLIFVSACGFAPDPYRNRKAKGREEWSYEYANSLCSTGKKAFQSKQALCAYVLNEEFNRNCARDLRLKLHAELCGEKEKRPQ